MTRKPWIHVRILIYRTWAILPVKQSCHDKKLYIEKQETEDNYIILAERVYNFVAYAARESSEDRKQTAISLWS